MTILSDTEFLPPHQRFLHCPQCAAPVAELGHNPFSCSECQFHFYFNPALAVAAVVTDAEGQVLLLERRRDPQRGMLSLPGGFVDLNETAEAALCREIREETNLTVAQPTIEFLSSHPNTYQYRGIEYIVTDLFFTCQVEDWSTLQAEPSEVAGVTYQAATEIDLDQIAFPSIKQALQLYRERKR